MKPIFQLLSCGLLLLSAESRAADPPGVNLPDARPTPSPAPAASTVPAVVQSVMDGTANPCEDFYQYACGGWLKTEKMPADRPRWARSFSVLSEHSNEVVRQILKDAQRSPNGADQERIGRFFASCMDEAAIEQTGARPLAAPLAEIAKVDGPESLFATAGKLRRQEVATLFRFAVEPDPKDPNTDLADLSQGGLGMPDRDYYLSTDTKKKALLEAYQKHVGAMFALLGVPAPEAQSDAARVVAFETALAKASRPREEMRLPEMLYHKLDLPGLKKLAPKLAWSAYLASAGHPEITSINVSVPEFFTALEGEVLAARPEILRAYLRWHLLHAAADRLPKAFVDENFAFYGKELSGQKEIRPRWKRCVAATQDAFGEAVGKLYVEREFGGASKTVALEMIGDIESAFRSNLPELAWMDETTRQRALDKVKVLANKIAYPDTWRDYSKVKIVPGDYFANAAAAAAFEFDRQANKVGKPVDRSEWGITPQTVNAYYNPLWNEIVFPAAILQPPFFNKDFPAAMNYGGIGAVIGHELTHGFDDQGRKFDPQGRLQEWWSPAVTEKFETRAQCVRDRYSSFEIEPGYHVNGKLTAGESIADIGGLKEAYSAYKSWEIRHGAPAPAVEGLTNDQLFFVAFGQVWCALVTPERARFLLTVDPHAPDRFRVIGAVSANPAFAEAFQCPAGTPMNPATKCEVW